MAWTALRTAGSPLQKIEGVDLACGKKTLEQLGGEPIACWWTWFQTIFVATELKHLTPTGLG